MMRGRSALGQALRQSQHRKKFTLQLVAVGGLKKLEAMVPVTPESNLIFQFVAENSADILCLVGMDRVMRYVSPASTRLLGWTPEELTGRGPEGFVLDDDLPRLAEEIQRRLALKIDYGTITLRMKKKDGGIAWMEFNSQVVRDQATGEAKEVVLVVRDVTERTLREERLAAQALTDSLTELPNRRAFDDALSREWKRTRREKTRMALLLLDIDHFKEFNDQYGHMMGDDCLRAVAGTIKAMLRGSDFAARFGGEEFAIILPATRGTAAMQVAEKVRAAIEKLDIPHAHNHERGCRVTTSIGVTTAEGQMDETCQMPEGLLLAADHALYRAKREGRNRVEISMDMTPRRFGV